MSNKHTRYVDAKTLRAAVIAYHDTLKTRSISKLTDAVIYDVLDIIDEAPAADVAQVVRCKDCVCMGKRPPLPGGYREDCGWCMLHGHVALPEDFCSNGERMDDAAGAAEGGKIKMSEWIDVKERLPEKGDPVVALCHYEFAPDKYYIMAEQYTSYSNMWLDGSVRYWMLLPPLPREEEHE